MEITNVLTNCIIVFFTKQFNGEIISITLLKCKLGSKKERKTIKSWDGKGEEIVVSWSGKKLLNLD